ncbi:MAG TPA: hemolysin III family protein [Kofleriaceae bacterium]|nr:hemolysin III family protein [Kofleriaceae bacterium]
MTVAKPRLRGVSHQIAFYVALCAGAALIAATGDARSMAATAVYVVSLAAMLGVSASYHRVDWSPRVEAWWRRADHAMIFAFIAGTYTPLSLLGLDRATGHRLFALAWTAAGLGILRAVLWPRAPRVVASVLYVAVGWVVVAYFPAVRAALDPLSLTLLLIGGICYTVGAVVYAARRPDPAPAVFGYHEVFHALVLIACGCHFAAVARVAIAR